MNKQELDNLKLLIKCKYKHVCMNPYDFKQLIVVPSVKNNFYPFNNKKLYDKKGFYKNEDLMVTLWTNYSVTANHIRIADKLPGSGFDTVWSEAMPFTEPNSVDRIQRIMNLKVFW